jgi:peptide/nickel transport system substrate-binding protein
MKTARFLAMFGVLAALIVPSFAQEKSATFSLPQEPDSLNSLYTTMTFAGYAIQLQNAPAWDFGADSQPRPVLAAEMPSAENGGLSEDGTVITIKLKEGLVWSDGDALDSADFLFTAEMINSEANNPLGRNPYDIATFSAPDATTVVVTFAEPYAPWLGLFRYVLPEHVLRPVFDAEGTLDTAEYNFNPTVSSGPYILQEWSRGSFMRFAVNPNFVGGTANIQTLVVTFIPDEQAYKTAFLNGEAQLGTFLPFSDVPDLQAAGLNVQVVDSGYNEGMFINVGPNGNPALQDVRVRQALGLGFDRFGVVEDLLLGATIPAATQWENTIYANPDLEAIPYDPEQARALLEEAGWVDSNGDGIRERDGVDLTLRFVTSTRQIRRDIQALAQQQWGEIGINVVLENYESDIFFNGYADGGPIATGQFDVTEWSSSPAVFPDPNSSAWDCDEIASDANPSGSNWTGYCNEEVDALLKQQRTTTDFDTRVELWHQLTNTLYNDYVWLGVWFDADVWWTGNGLIAGPVNGVSPFWDIVNWDVE